MTLWDLFFTSQPTAPPQLGGLVFLVADLIGSGGSFCLFDLLTSKGYQNFWYWGQLIQLLIINAWYLAARLPLSESLPFYHSRMAMWIILLAPKGSFKQYFALSGSLWLHYGLGSSRFLSLPFSSRFLDQQCLWSLGSPGQLFDLSGSILPGGRRGCLENLSDDVWGQCHYSAC